jgi:hypothetical protein
LLQALQRELEVAKDLLVFDAHNELLHHNSFIASKKAKKSILHGDSDDEDEPNTYDYNDSFIDDEGIDNGQY